MRDDALDTALERVERDGVPLAMDPATVALRSRLVREHLVRFDDERGSYVLTQTGRQRLALRRTPAPPPGTVTPFRRPSGRKG